MRFLDKKILILIVLLFSLPAVFSAVEIKGFVNDYAGIIAPEEKTQIEDALKQIYDSGIAQYSIVTVKSLEGKDIESYSLELAQGNLGDSKKDNGLLLLVALEERKYRFEVGRGIEYILNDAKVGRIGRTYLVPNFQNENYSKGILEASLAIKSVLLGEASSEYYVEGDKIYHLEVFGIVVAIIVIIFLLVLPVMISHATKKMKYKSKYFDAATGAVILFGGRGGNGGFSGGGFGGFGGGGFGGGGAGGGW